MTDCTLTGCTLNDTFTTAAAHVGLTHPDGFWRRNLPINSPSVPTNTAKGQHWLSWISSKLCFDTTCFKLSRTLNPAKNSALHLQIAIPKYNPFVPVGCWLFCSLGENVENTVDVTFAWLSNAFNKVRCKFWWYNCFVKGDIWEAASKAGSSFFLCYFSGHDDGKNLPYPPR